LDPNEPAVTDIALQNFDVDVQFLEDFVKNLGDPTIVDTFLELRQVKLQSLNQRYSTPIVNNTNSFTASYLDTIR